MADKYYAVIDTNVIVSALISKKAESYPLSVMAHVYSGVIIPVFNDEIINEYKDVLSREKFHLNQSDIVLAMKAITDYGVNLERTKVNVAAFPASERREIAPSFSGAIGGHIILGLPGKTRERSSF